MKKHIKTSIKAFYILLSAFCILPFSAFAQLNWSGDQVFTTNTTINQNINITGNVNIYVAQDVTVTINGVISGGSMNNFIKYWPGFLVLNGDNTCFCTITVWEGELHIGNGGTIGSLTCQINLSGGNLRINRSNAYTHSGIIGGFGNVHIGGWTGGVAGTITFSALHTYTGETRITSDMTLVLGANTSIQNSSNVKLQQGIYSTTKLVLMGNKTIKSLTADYNSEINLGAHTLTIGTAGQNDGGGILSGKFTGSGSVTKTGTATFTMFDCSDNTATGTFTHSQGTVEFFHGKWGGNYTKAAGATLTVQSNPIIAGNLTLAGGNINMEYLTYYLSKLTVTGSVTATGTNTFNITGCNYPIENYVLIEAASGITSVEPYTLTPMSEFPYAGLSVNSPTQLLFGTSSLIVPVTDITDLPDCAQPTIPLLLTGTVVPSNATFQNITWVIGVGPATLSGDTLYNTGMGYVELAAKIVNDEGVQHFWKNFTIQVITPPSITTTTLPDGFVGTICYYNQDLSATISNEYCDWSIESGNLPDGLNLSTYGTLAGYPTETGIFNFTVKVANCAGYDTKTFEIFIGGDPEITTTSLPNGLVGTAYNAQLETTGTTSAVTWEYENLPNGLSISTSGLISGTPTVAGTYNFVVRLYTYAGGCGAWTEVKFLPITITTTAVAPIITTTTLPGGVIGTAYNQQLSATGTAPITWSLASGSLPAGLNLSTSGVISGTPNSAGTSNFTVKATNSTGNDTKTLSITITASAVKPTITTTTLPDGKTGIAYNAQLAATGTAPITWALASGNLPAGLTLSTAGKISGTPTAKGTSNFIIQATNSAGNATKALSIRIEDGVGILENETSGITVYPNPVTNVLTIKSDNILPCNIALYDIQGRQIKATMEYTENEIRVDMSKLSAGVYILKVGNETVRVLKE